MSATAALSFEGIGKRYPGVQALADVSIEVRPGEVHALCGENGAGKSTLMKIAAGSIRPDSGTMRVHGTEVSHTGPRDALAVGVALVPQEISLVQEMTVAENLLLGIEPRSGPVIRSGAARRSAALLLAGLGRDIDPDRRLSSLSAAEQQLVSIARVAAVHASTIIFDEPTAALSGPEVEVLFRLIRRLVAEGSTVVYCSHRLAEIIEIADRVSVLRDGRLVGTRAVAGMTESDIVAMMVGAAFSTEPAAPATTFGETVLDVSGLGDGDAVRDASFQVRSGEILGFGGLIGAGRSELMELLIGRRRPTGGAVRYRGQPVRVRSPLHAARLGIGFVPEERKRQAIFPELRTSENVLITSMREWSVGGLLRRRPARAAVDRVADRVALAPAALERTIRTLSGGNQQKGVVARWLLRAPQLLILDEPTRGIDVRAKSDMYRIIQEIAEHGAAVIVVSSELEELFHLCHRVLVMRGGRLVAELDPRTASHQEFLGHAMVADDRETALSAQRADPDAILDAVPSGND